MSQSTWNILFPGVLTAVAAVLHHCPDTVTPLHHTLYVWSFNGRKHPTKKKMIRTNKPTTSFCQQTNQTTQPHADTHTHSRLCHLPRGHGARKPLCRWGKPKRPSHWHMPLLLLSVVWPSCSQLMLSDGQCVYVRVRVFVHAQVWEHVQSCGGILDNGLHLATQWFGQPTQSQLH